MGTHNEEFLFNEKPRVNKSEELEKKSNRSKMGLDYEVEQIIFHFLNEMFVCVCTYVLSP